MEEFVKRGAASVMEEARAIVGAGRTYVTFDVDSIDPSMAPGIFPDEKAVSAIAALQAAVAYYQSLGVTVTHVMPPLGD